MALSTVSFSAAWRRVFLLEESVLQVSLISSSTFTARGVSLEDASAGTGEGEVSISLSSTTAAEEVILLVGQTYYAAVVPLETGTVPPTLANPLAVSC